MATITAGFAEKGLSGALQLFFALLADVRSFGETEDMFGIEFLLRVRLPLQRLDRAPKWL